MMFASRDAPTNGLFVSWRSSANFSILLCITDFVKCIILIKKNSYLCAQYQLQIENIKL